MDHDGKQTGLAKDLSSSLEAVEKSTNGVFHLIHFSKPILKLGNRFFSFC
jgi:hypothetical protein